MAVMTEKPDLIETDQKVPEQETHELTERDIILGPHPRKSTDEEPKK